MSSFQLIFLNMNWRCWFAIFVTCLSVPPTNSYLMVNPEKNLVLGFLWQAPVSLILPTAANVNNGRAFNTMIGQEEEEDFIVEDSYKIHIDRVDMFFELLQVPTLACEERMICEFGKDPDNYSPVSDLILKELKLRHGPPLFGDKSLMWRYIEAAQAGIRNETVNCGAKYHKCPLPAYKLLNMSVIKVLQWITSKLNMMLIAPF